MILFLFQTNSASQDDSSPTVGESSQTNGDQSDKNRHLPGEHKQDGGAMHQCITELSSSLRRNEHERHRSTSPTSEQGIRKTSLDNDSVETTQPTGSDQQFTVINNQESTKVASHFVTVIEVKETLRSDTAQSVEPTPHVTEDDEKQNSESETEVAVDKFVSAPLAAVLEAKKKIPPRWVFLFTPFTVRV